ncbi:MAG TPA: bacteriophage abortive infection AbiH family protein [Bacilli bacterium]|nr:bacteriophage abortive infection AbiH family protein [Bacilli bacterium]
MRLFIIGNGFDLHHNLNTRYSSFKDFVVKRDWEVFKKVDDIFERYRCDEPTRQENWADIETQLRKFNDIDFDEIAEEVWENCETDMDRASFYNDPIWLPEECSKFIPLLHKYFDDWIKSIDDSLFEVQENFRFSCDDLFISFNYTKTLENHFGIKRNQILYIHGKVGEKLIFGHNEESDLVLPYRENYDEDSDIRTMDVERGLNEVARNTHGKYFKDSAKIIADNEVWFSHLERFSQVYFLGFGFGQEDQRYIDRLLTNINESNVETKVVVYNNEDKCHATELFSGLKNVFIQYWDEASF